MDMPSGSVIGLLHPGEMGASVGRCLTQAGHVVLWASQGRGPETAARARAAGLQDVGTAEEMAGRAEIILSICPPHAALDMAWAVQGFGGLFVDANAISPATAREVAAMVEDCGAGYVDGGIIGPPPTRRNQAWLYLAGDHAAGIAPCFSNGPLEVEVLAGGIGRASALKMCFAAYSKGSIALAMAVLAAAERLNVLEDLKRQWARNGPSLPDLEREISRAAPKSWRFAGEMREIATTFQNAGLPSGFHQAAAEIFRRLEEFKNLDPAVRDVMATLLK